MSSIDEFVLKVVTILLNPLIRLMIAVAALYFLWGVAKFVMNSDNEQERKTGAQHMMWGLIGLVIMIGVHGLLGILRSSLNISEDSHVIIQPDDFTQDP